MHIQYRQYPADMVCLSGHEHATKSIMSRQFTQVQCHAHWRTRLSYHAHPHGAYNRWHSLLNTPKSICHGHFRRYNVTITDVPHSWPHLSCHAHTISSLSLSSFLAFWSARQRFSSFSFFSFVAAISFSFSVLCKAEQHSTIYHVIL